MSNNIRGITHIAFFNPQANFDRNDSHLAEHPDFGGQLVYVKELAKAMGELGIQVDIITRLINDEKWREFSEQFDFYPDAPNVRIVRIPFAGNQFLRKEDLWDYLPEYVDGIYRFYESEGSFPEFVTTHYGDGGVSGVLFMKRTTIPFSFTAHSLGAWKRDKLIAIGCDEEEIEKKYKFSIRTCAENLALKYASFVVCSTTQERYEQYSHKAYMCNPYDDKFKVIPPGINHKIFNTRESEIDLLMEKYIEEKLSKAPLNRQRLPFVLMSSRIDKKKNHISVVKAFLNDEQLLSSANLFIILRGIDDIEKFAYENDTEEARILKEIIDIAKAEIGRSIFFANISDQITLASFYRVCAKRGSVFVLPATYEPFGLAIIEAAACGLKLVATKNGGPVEILSGGEGLLIDPDDIKDISSKLYISLTQFTNEKSLLLANRYSWKNTAFAYLQNMMNCPVREQNIDDREIETFYRLIKPIQ
ncbi:MAG TPA: glycosyltransferase [Fervidobacterium sp.]|nr:glycosyltransferase [Fervidobacterium sp.]HOM74153.1 glycosyltransferase [Fervidobacterium sp.]HPP17805.1 glycosyltransferase [Fervidobacterium sp.]